MGTDGVADQTGAGGTASVATAAEKDADTSVAIAGRAPTVSELADDVADLVRVVEELRIERDHDRALLDELVAQLASGGGGASGADLGDPVYKAWIDWVDEWLLPRIDRSPHRHRWCDRYADHPEVAGRFEALWATWEASWPTALLRSAWFRDHLDHHWAVVTSEDGPLRDCAPGAHRRPDPVVTR